MISLKPRISTLRAELWARPQKIYIVHANIINVVGRPNVASKRLTNAARDNYHERCHWIPTLGRTGPRLLARQAPKLAMCPDSQSLDQDFRSFAADKSYCREIKEGLPRNRLPNAKGSGMSHVVVVVVVVTAKRSKECSCFRIVQGLSS